MTAGDSAIIRAGVFQPATGGTPTERIDRLATALKGRALDLVVCPELFPTGYDIGDAVRDGAEAAGGPSARSLAAVAREAACAIVYGYAERAGDRLYNAAGIVGATGTAVATHRKTVLPPGFEATYFSTGEGLVAFDCRGIRIAILICYEVEFPEAVRAAAEAGAQAIAVPTALGDAWWSVAHRMIPTRAFENGVWLLYSNHTGHEGGTRYLDTRKNLPA